MIPRGETEQFNNEKGVQKHKGTTLRFGVLKTKIIEIKKLSIYQKIEKV